MVYLLQHNFHTARPLRQELTRIYGLHNFLAQQICDHLGISPQRSITQCSRSQIEALTRLVNHYYVTRLDLKRQQEEDIRRTIQIGSYRGFRTAQKLPCRGQRTHTNAHTARKLHLRNLQKTK